MSKISAVRAFGAYADAGQFRSVNEDTYLAFSEKSLFGVADGFGGAGVGDVTSKQLLEDVKYFVEHGLSDSEVTLPFVYRQYYNTSANLIFNAFLYANERLFRKNKTVAVNAKGGASLLFSFFEGNTLTLASVGSCQAFLIRKGRVQSLIKPRSYNHFKGQFQGSWNSKWAFPLVAMGMTKDIEPEILQLQVGKGDLIILCTDGLYGGLGEADISECFSLFTKQSAMDLAIHEQNQRLIELAGMRGSQDNLALISMVCM